MKPTIGIVGGCGPLATVDIEYKILKATKRLLYPLLDQNYFNMLIFNYTQFSDRNDAIAINDKTLFGEFLRCARALESIGINLLLVACQTAHVYVPGLKSAIDLPIVDIIEETVGSIVKSFPRISKVGLLSTEATQNKQLYQNALASYNIEVVSVSAEIQSKMMEAIYIIKTGVSLIKGKNFLNNSQYCIQNEIKNPKIRNHPYRRILLEKKFPNPLTTIQEAIHYLANNECQHVILGCTELPLILPHINLKKIGVNLIDPNTIVAESAVILANKLEQERIRGIMPSVNCVNKINKTVER
jgi:aspartate racemase